MSNLPPGVTEEDVSKAMGADEPELDPEPKHPPKRYLGDSVYIEVSNGMFVVTTDNGTGPSNTIFFEVETYREFVKFAKQCGVK